MPERSFQALALVLPAIAVLAPKGVAPWLCLCALPALIAGWRQGWRPQADRQLGGILIAWLVWALISCAWTLKPWDATVMWARDGSLVLLAILLVSLSKTLNASNRQSIGTALVIGLALGTALMAIELTSDHGIYRLVTGHAEVSGGDNRLNRGATLLLLLLPAAALSLQSLSLQSSRWHLGTAALAILTLSASLATPSATAKIAAVAMLAAGILAYGHTRLAAALFALAGLAAVAGMPLIAEQIPNLPQSRIETLPDSAQHRLQIWQFTAERIAEKPWIGWGFNSAEAMPNFGVAPFFPDQEKVIPLHPHNAALQIRLDLGVPGVVLALCLLAVIARRCLANSAPRQRAMETATLAGAVTVALLGYGIWQEQWIASLICIGLLTPLASRKPD